MPSNLQIQIGTAAIKILSFICIHRIFKLTLHVIKHLQDLQHFSKIIFQNAEFKKKKNDNFRTIT